MEKTLERLPLETTAELPTEQTLEMPQAQAATDADILAYLRCSRKIAHIARLAEREALVLAICEKLSLTISDEEWQAAGDAFRLEHQLTGATATLRWLEQQQISAEEWSQGIKVEWLKNKLKAHLFGDVVDNHYISNRDTFKQVALSQILVTDLPEALKIARLLREENASFCGLALEHSKGKQSREGGGFMGTHFLSELMPEIVQAIAEASVGEIIGPVQTRFGHHILKIEKWYPIELSETVREMLLDLLFETWLQELTSRDRQVESAK